VHLDINEGHAAPLTLLVSFFLLGHIGVSKPESQQLTRHVVNGSESQTVDEREHFYSQVNVARSDALAVLVNGNKRLATVYSVDRKEAVSTMTGILARFSAGAALDDAALHVEVQLARDLLKSMENGAEQVDLYQLPGF